MMVNLDVNGVVFEVQIVLRSMLVARTSMDAHAAYNQFRSFAEVFDLLGIPQKGPEDDSESSQDEDSDGEDVAPSQLDTENGGATVPKDATIKRHATMRHGTMGHSKSYATLRHTSQKDSVKFTKDFKDVQERESKLEEKVSMLQAQVTDLRQVLSETKIEHTTRIEALEAFVQSLQRK